MNFTKALTPRDTEEIKPGLFIQKTLRGYRQISPAAWDGKIIWKNFLFGKDFMKSFLFFLIIIFLAWSYFHDIKVYREFYEDVNSNPAKFCINVPLVNINEWEITNPLQSNYREDPQRILPG